MCVVYVLLKDFNVKTGFKPVSNEFNLFKNNPMETKNESMEFSHEDGLKTIYAMIASTRSTIGENYLLLSSMGLPGGARLYSGVYSHTGGTL